MLGSSFAYILVLPSERQCVQHYVAKLVMNQSRDGRPSTV
jgi:hypothetical protein